MTLFFALLLLTFALAIPVVRTVPVVDSLVNNVLDLVGGLGLELDKLLSLVDVDAGSLCSAIAKINLEKCLNATAINTVCDAIRTEQTIAICLKYASAITNGDNTT